MNLRIPRTFLALLAAIVLVTSPTRAQAPDTVASPAAPRPAAAASADTPSPSATPAPDKTAAHDGGSTEDLAKATQNPVAALISVPFQSNTYFGLGERKATAELLKIQPVIPQNIGEWNLIHRTILPIAYLPYAGITPSSVPAPSGGDFGLGDITYTCFVSPAEPGKLIWGFGPAITVPTASHATLGAGKWSAGPSAVFLTSKGPVVAGMLLQQQWSFAGQSNRADISSGLVQPFFNYNFPKGWYFTSSPICTVDWNGDRGQKWTVPVGGGLGRVFAIGRQPVNVSAQLYYNAIRPVNSPSWDLRLSFSLLFPTHKTK